MSSNLFLFVSIFSMGNPLMSAKTCSHLSFLGSNAIVIVFPCIVTLYFFKFEGSLISSFKVKHNRSPSSKLNKFFLESKGDDQLLKLISNFFKKKGFPLFDWKKNCEELFTMKNHPCTSTSK